MPLDLQVQVIEIVSSTANSITSCSQHPHPLALFQILAIKERLVEYITSVVDAYHRENKPLFTSASPVT